MSRIMGADVRLDARGFYYRYPAKLGNSHGCIKDGGTPVPQRLKEYWRTKDQRANLATGLLSGIRQRK
ncbi:hypothetical protein [Pseudomonas fluorescens]|jgi:hypothetical protein|uniref:hypothetical protein n=1 Tax=Pseudomonas fluorescens TaxID=294 RepID=UPI00107205E2|nr:hypothetical protein [Pseudomonas fluorescens]